MFADTAAIKSEKIDVETFLRLVHEIRRNIDPEADFLEAFRAFDADGDGFLTPKELKAVYKFIAYFMLYPHFIRIYSYIITQGFRSLE